MSRYAICRHGHRHWGELGAAGLLLVHDGHVLLQKRAEATHVGGTWSTPGGAIDPGEDVLAAAAREAHEELGLTSGAYDVRELFEAVCGGWTYTTVIADVAERPTLVHQWESERLTWLAPHEVGALPLHPAFREAWDGYLASRV
jgi:8-oxo-dGTP pyrophosphatase MutT (NUDIX family)